MKIIGIIAEYNPFHLGHLYQINKIKEIYPDSIIIAIISTNFTQRGDISIINKWNKTKICLDNNIDIVLELPYTYATQSADIFANGALKILNSMHIDTLVFGTEKDNINELIKLAKIQIDNKEYDNIVKNYLSKGLNYPTAMSKALENISNIKIDKPNDLLALSYIKEIIKNNYNITPISIKRTIDYHSSDIVNNITSASNIRTLIQENKDITNYIPTYPINYIEDKLNLNYAYPYLKYSIIKNINSLDKYLTIEEGIENRIKKYIYECNNWQSLVMKIKTKRYTYNKINRMLTHILLGYTKEENKEKDCYTRVLGFNQRGRKYLNTIKKQTNIIYGYKKNLSNSLDIEFRSTCIYALITNNTKLIDLEFKNKPIIK